jgi:hypothetical protein
LPEPLEEPLPPDSPDRTWYLCLSTGRPKEWRTKPPKGRRLGLIVSYGVKNRILPEYWFHIVNNDDVQEFYKFWMIWWPHLYSGHIDTEVIHSFNLHKSID